MRCGMLREGPAVAEGAVGCPHVGLVSPPPHQVPPRAGGEGGQRAQGCQGSDPTVCILQTAPWLSISLGTAPPEMTVTSCARKGPCRLQPCLWSSSRGWAAAG